MKSFSQPLRSLLTRASLGALLLSASVAVTACGGDDGGDGSPMGPDATMPDAGTLVDAGPTVDAGDLPDAGDTDGGVGVIGEGVATLAGGEEAGTTDGTRAVATLRNPAGLAVGPNGNVYIAEFDNDRIRKITPEGTVSTLTQAAGFDRPFGLAFGDDGTLYAQTDADDQGDSSGGALWTVNLDTGTPTLVASGIGRARGLAPLSDGRLVLVYVFQDIIQIFDPEGLPPAPELLAGAAEDPGFADGNGAEARFDRPLGVAVVDDEIYVADSANHRIRKITLDGEVSTLAGTGVAASSDGSLAEATFDTPYAMTRDSDGNLYVTELGDSFRVRKIDLVAETVETIAGSGMAGFKDAEEPLEAQFFGLEGVGVDKDSMYLYVSDGNRGQEPAEEHPYHRVRRISLTP